VWDNSSSIIRAQKYFAPTWKKFIPGPRDLFIPECSTVIAVDSKNHVKQTNKHTNIHTHTIFCVDKMQYLMFKSRDSPTH